MSAAWSFHEQTHCLDSFRTSGPPMSFHRSHINPNNQNSGDIHLSFMVVLGLSFRAITRKRARRKSGSGTGEKYMARGGVFLMSRDWTDFPRPFREWFRTNYP